MTALPSSSTSSAIEEEQLLKDEAN